MEAKELRIGNWIADRGGKQWQIDFWEAKNKVSAKEPEINLMGMKYRVHPLTEYVDYLQPIELTEAWLKMFGFVKDLEYDNCYTLKLENDFYLDGIGFGESNLKYDVILTDSNNNELTIIKHAHELQNLYFALTNKELIC